MSAFVIWIGILPPPRGQQPVHRAPNPRRPAVEDMSIDHCGSDIPVSQKLLDCPDVVAGFEEMSGEGVAEGVAGCAGGQAGLDHGISDCSLDEGMIDVVPSLLAGLRVPPAMFLGEDLLPAPFSGRPGVLPAQRIGQLNQTPAFCHVSLMYRPDPFQMLLKRSLQGFRKHGDAVLAPLAVADEHLA